MLTDAHRHNLLNTAERQQFERDGFLRLPAALTAAEVEELKVIAIDIQARIAGSGFDPYRNAPYRPNRPLFYPDLLPTHQAMINLLDHPSTFPKVWPILGSNIYCYHTHMIISPPMKKITGDKRRFGFHQDSGRVNADLETEPRPRLSVKLAYWLTDLTEPNRANLYVVPGSHLENDPGAPREDLPQEAVPILAKPGDALLFDRRLWHSSSTNQSEHTRIALFFGYGPRWIRPKDEMSVTDEMLRGNDPIRAQLMGATPDNNRRYTPRPGDLPLENWLDEQGLLTPSATQSN